MSPIKQHASEAVKYQRCYMLFDLRLKERRENLFDREEEIE